MGDRGLAIAKIALNVTVLAAILFAAAIFGFTRSAPTFAETRAKYRPSDAWIVDRGGHPLETVRIDARSRGLAWVPWDEVSPAFRELLVETEDRRFFAHPGVDALAAVKALATRITGGKARGASTLTMQLSGLLRNEAGGSRGLLRKLRQLLEALRLDAAWSKEEILEAYVNLAPSRGELVGLRAASLGFFAKNPAGLTRDEAALLVALLRAPNAPPPLVAKRACAALKINGTSECSALAAKSEQVLAEPYRIARSRTLVPVVSNKFLIETDDATGILRSSLDRRVQTLAIHSLREQLEALRGKNARDGAVLVLETKTGLPVAYVANGGANATTARQIDGVLTLRQAGSTLKPFVYATAFDWRLLRAGSLLEDSPADIAVGEGRVYHPRNYDQIFRGLVGVGDALGSSMNVPAVRALGLVGEPRVLEKMRAAGFTHLKDDDYYGPSLALGAVDVTLWELAQAYRRFAVEDSPFSAETRGSIFNILAAPEHRRFTFGMDGILSLPFAAAVKTGTSKDMRDNWCIGWTDEYVVAVWVGNFDGAPMWNVSGLSGAAPVWRSLMLALHPGKSGSPVAYVPSAAPLSRKAISRFRYPAAGMLVGLDPDIPRDLQKLPIEIENPQAGHRVLMDRRPLGPSGAETLWTIAKGKHRLELRSARDELIDEIHFEVR